MELRQLSYGIKVGSKVKMKLIQPKFKCSVRDDVICYYRGKIVRLIGQQVEISFKYKGKFLLEWLDLTTNTFNNEELKNIKIISVG